MIVVRRPETPADGEFLNHLIADVISAEWGAAEWPEALRTQLLAMQCEGRRRAAEGSESSILTVNGIDAGWMAIQRLPEEVRLVEIMIDARFQGQGVGSHLVRELLSEAKGLGVPLRLYVNRTNAGAVRFYERLGFVATGGNEVQQLMVCNRMESH